MSADPDRRRRIDAVFDAALDLEGEARDDYLVEACRGDEPLRKEVEALLAAAETESGPSMADFPHLAVALGEELEGPRIAGRRIGPYRVIEPLGRGGMGAVFLAERADGAFEKRVAVKVLPWTMASPALAERFDLERQILADLEHPNVARLLDGGTTPDGLPYLVMEYVGGEPIDHYCETRQLAIRDRLELFLEVCKGVAFAHENMVLHRDVKPGNVLVTAAGAPKLLDFGIAKLVDPKTPVTMTRGDVGPLTPAYAAPEQLRGEPVSTTTDVYALGALLYRLLGDRPPHEPEDHSWAELLRRIDEATPPAPSTQVEDPEQARRLTGDLDAIVLQALASDPSRRYPSVRALMDDIERHLEGRPVTARRPTVAYRTGKFVRRNPGAVTASVLILLSLLVSLFMAARQIRTEERARHRAERVSAFLTDLLTVVDPRSGTGATIDSGRLLDRGVGEAGATLSDEPELQAEILSVLGKAAEERGLYDRSAEIYRDAWELRRRLDGPDAESTLAIARELGWALGMAGQIDAAMKIYERASELARGRYGEDSEAFAATLHARASLTINAPAAKHLRDPDELEGLLRRALRIRRELYPEGHGGVAAVLHDLAYVVKEAEEKERLFREALAMQRRIFPEPHEATARIANDLALFLESRGRPAEAARLMEEALEIHTSHYGPLHPVSLRILNNLAGVLRDMDRPAEAEPLYREALESSRASLPAGELWIAYPLYGLGRVLLAQGELEEAEERLREAHEILSAHDSPLRHPVASTLGEALRRQGRSEKAQPLLQGSLEALESEDGLEAYTARARERVQRLERAAEDR